MGNDSGDRSNQVQDGENNGNGEKSPVPVTLKRHRNEEKDSLARISMQSDKKKEKV